jgi:hypothetical protein
MAKNNQKKEKAARNREYARKFRKKPVSSRRGGPRPPMGSAPASGAPAVVGSIGAPTEGALHSGPAIRAAAPAAAMDSTP